jgi:hypothetical protein
VPFTSQQTLTAAALNTALLAGAVIGRARRTTSSTTSTGTTRVAVLRLDDIPLTAGRIYEIRTGGLQIDGVTNNDTMIIDIVYTTDGSTPTTASSLLAGASSETIQPNAASPVYSSISTTYTPAGNETLSLLLTIKHGVGTGAMGLLATGTTSIIEMLIIDRGVDPGDTGVDL